MSQAYVSDLTTDAERTDAIARLSTVTGIAFIFGPLIGSMLSRVDLRLPLAVASLLFVVDSVVGLQFLPDVHVLAKPAHIRNRHHPNRGHHHDKGWNLLGAFHRARDQLVSSVGRVLLIRFFFHVMHAFFQDTLLLFLMKRFNFDSQSNGIVLSMLGVLAVLVQGVVVPYCHRRFDENVSADRSICSCCTHPRLMPNLLDNHLAIGYRGGRGILSHGDDSRLCPLWVGHHASCPGHWCSDDVPHLRVLQGGPT